MLKKHAWAFVAAFALAAAQGAWAHPGHGSMWSALYDHMVGNDPAQAPAQGRVVVAAADAAAPATPPAPPAPDPNAVSGQGDLKFRVFATGKILPGAAGPVLVKAHGGFAIDRREGHGETYFALPGAGIIQLSADLKTSTLIETPAEVRDTNQHNTCLWYGKDGTPYLAFPANDANKVFTLSLDGKLLNTLEPPTNKTFAVEAVTKYFSEPKNKFVPTDIEMINSMYFIPTGYSALDYVLEAKVTEGTPLQVSWTDQAFGGKGDGPGQFQTGHGITLSPDKTVINVADRPHSEVDRFSTDGKYKDTVALPAGSLPCDTAFESGYMVVGCLEGPDKAKGAPIYICKDDKVVSTIMPKEDLGLSQFTHVHNATAKKIGNKLYIIAQAWNPGDFAVFEQVQ